MKVLRIRNWDAHFENSESRKVKNARWVPMPNRFDGKGFKRVTRLQNARDVLLGWMLLVEIASRMPTRGTFADEDGPLSSADFSDMTNMDSEIFDKATQALVVKEIMWLEEVEFEGISGHHPDTSGDAGAEGREGRKGIEGKGRGGKEASPPPGSPPRFSHDDVKRILDAYPLQIAMGSCHWHVEQALVDVASKKPAPKDPVAWLLEKVRLYSLSDEVVSGKASRARYWFSDKRYDDDPAHWNKTAKATADKPPLEPAGAWDYSPPSDEMERAAEAEKERLEQMKQEAAKLRGAIRG